MRRPAAALLILSILAVARPLPASAQGTARVMDIDTSIRSAGMGGASTAVFFGDDLNAWANPALLGYASGLRYQRTHTQLVPGLAPDVDFDTEHLSFGAGGVGLAVSGRPAFDGVKLDYGPDPAVDGFERVKSWGFGVSALRAAEGILRVGGAKPAAVSDRVDLSFGMNFKRTHVEFFPGLGDDGNTVDWGVLFRGTPYETSPGANAPIRVDVSLGYSVVNADDEIFFENSFFGGAPPTRQQRAGFALRLGLDPPLWGLAPAGSRAWYLEGLTPAYSFAVAEDWVRASSGGGAPDFQTWGSGIEASFANVLTLRTGYFDDHDGEIQDPTVGIGIALPIGKVAGARYDHAWFPQPRDSGIHELNRDAFTVWLDPLEAWALARHGRSE